MTRRGRLADLWFRTLSSAHSLLLRLGGWRLGARVAGMTIVELHTIGRRSGRRRTVILSAPIVDGERVVLVASKGGDDRDPAWYRNLIAHPLVDLSIGETTRAMIARPADTAERAELWPKVVASYGGYATYQQRTKREIPLVICEPHE